MWVWWSLRLVFDLGPPGSPGVYVDVTSFRFTDPEGAEHALDVKTDPVAAGRVLSVLHRRVTSAVVDNWELRLTFDNGAVLVCPPDAKYEAWQASLPGETSIFCPLGGGEDSPD